MAKTYIRDPVVCAKKYLMVFSVVEGWCIRYMNLSVLSSNMAQMTSKFLDLIIVQMLQDSVIIRAMKRDHEWDISGVWAH